MVSRSEEITASYTSTVAPLWDKHPRILGGKTGHTEAAGYCLLISAEVEHRVVVMAFLGGKTSDARFDDFARVVAWLEASATTAPEPARPVDEQPGWSP